MKLKSEQRKVLYSKLVEEYIKQLDQFGPKGFSKKTRADLEAGFRDGVSSALRTLETLPDDAFEPETTS